MDDSWSWRHMKAAYLTTRLINEIQRETLNEILVTCEGRLAPITLLKGSSSGTDLYPQPYLRVMRDLDLLVDPREQPKLERVLRELGFRQQSKNSHEFYATHHHSMPFYHSRRDVWVEVHRALFPPGSKVADLAVFSPGNIAAESRPSWFHGVPVMRLSTELQIVYTASHWALELKRVGGLFALLDIIYLLKRGQRNIRWDTICKWVRDSVAGAHLYIVLSYLKQNNIIDLDKVILADLRACQRSFGMVNLKITHHLITRYLAAGKKPISESTLSALWEYLLLDQGPPRNLIFASKNLFPSFEFRRTMRN